MFIAHLPAGYVVSKLLAPRFGAFGASGCAFIGAGLAGSVAPDLDMLYFHFVDLGRQHHHAYWTHYPAVWLGGLLAALAWLLIRNVGQRPALAVIFALNGLVHVALDSLVGDIRWLAPLRDDPFALVTVPALHQPWWLNFIVHWTFVLELIVVAAAIALWSKSRAEHDKLRQSD